MRVHDLLNGLPLQRQQDIIDCLRISLNSQAPLQGASERRSRPSASRTGRRSGSERAGMDLSWCCTIVRTSKPCCKNSLLTHREFPQEHVHLICKWCTAPSWTWHRWAVHVKASHFKPHDVDHYEDARDGQWFAEAWEYVQGRHPEADGVLPVVIYSDETHVSRSRNVHVLLVFIALPMHIMRADGGLFRYLAFPPSFKGRDIGLSKSEGKRFQLFKREAKLASIHRALDGLKDLSYRSLTFQVGKDCTPLRLVPLPCNCIAHLPEANMLLNIKNYLAAHCDIHTNLDRAEFDKPDAVGQVWTVEGMKTEGRHIASEVPSRGANSEEYTLFWRQTGARIAS